MSRSSLEPGAVIDLLDRIATAIAERQHRWTEYLRNSREWSQQAETQKNTEAAQLKHWLESETRRIEEWTTQQTEHVEQTLGEEHERLQDEFEVELETVEKEYNEKSRAAEKEHEDGKWMVSSYFDESAKDSPKQRYSQFKRQQLQTRQNLRSQLKTLEVEVNEHVAWMQAHRIWSNVVFPEIAPMGDSLDSVQEKFDVAIEDCRTALAKLKSLWLPRLFSGVRPFCLVLIPSLIVFGVLFLFVDPASLNLTVLAESPEWIGGSGLAGLIVFLPLVLILWGIARHRASRHNVAAHEAAARATFARRTWHQLFNAERKRLFREGEVWAAEVDQQRRAALAKVNEKHSREIAVIRKERDAGLAAARQKYPPLIEDCTARLATAKETIVKTRETHRRQIAEQYEQGNREWTERAIASHDDVAKRDHETRRAVVESWASEWDDIVSEADDRNVLASTGFPEWEQWVESRPVMDEVPTMIPIGEFQVALDDWDGGVPNDPALRPQHMELALPIGIDFSTNPSLMLQIDRTGRAAAASTLQAVMLRLLTSIPAGRLRLTMIDPVGLGEDFSAFMHLGDYEELLINSRIWTQAGQIERQLQKITEHMENVLQAYLRDDFETIDAYNRAAGEIAEPYHVVVVANFPVGFTDSAARRLQSIAASGPRCGVFLLMSCDPSQNMPSGFDLNDLTAQMTNLQWDKDTFYWMNDELADVDLRLIEPPASPVFRDIVRTIGERSKDVRRVEVSFDRIAPGPEDVWRGDSRRGIEVALGRAGATKLQFMRLGRGTSQHVLVAGKTGSGKSTFLHALITNLALHYGPDEVAFFLVDFKKGVEFKTYATHGLPHAKVVAIESDREFGLSVLRRLNDILSERGELFRHHQVQDLAAFRDLCDENTDIDAPPMPRLMLIVDEFQEFFVEDDKLAQDSSLLLDRLVRQGRAFGIHVLLGSQTLGGAYSLARSTVGQMAVRVALQCSDTDAHLILSEENTAARLLTRPGEAIYNDANGLLEGNHPFQIAWLADEQREHHLKRLGERATTDRLNGEPAIVFEGNIPANPLQSPVFEQLMSERKWESEWTNEQAKEPTRIWLGDPVEIRETSALKLHRQTGHNVLIIGQSADGALGILPNVVVGAGLQWSHVDGGQSVPRIIVCQGEPDQDTANIWNEATSVVPVAVDVRNAHDVGAAIADLAAEVATRDESAVYDAAPILLVVHNLARFRDLRRDQDDFGFGSVSSDREATPAEQFQEILRNGPAVGIHVLVWCDSHNNLDRWLSRQSIREFEIRVAFPMSAADSSNLLDSPVASRLGPNRALLYSVEKNSVEKFRPFGRPEPEWIDKLRSVFSNAEDELIEPSADDLNLWSVS